MKRMSLVLACVLVLSFSIVGCKTNVNEQDLHKTVASTLGYLIAEKRTDLADDMLKWYSTFVNVTDEDFPGVYQEGFSKLIAMVSGSPFLTMQIQNAVNMLGISATGPKTPDEIEEYRYIIDAFMLGASAAPRTV